MGEIGKGRELRWELLPHGTGCSVASRKLFSVHGGLKFGGHSYKLLQGPNEVLPFNHAALVLTCCSFIDFRVRAFS